MTDFPGGPPYWMNPNMGDPRLVANAPGPIVAAPIVTAPPSVSSISVPPAPSIPVPAHLQVSFDTYGKVITRSVGQRKLVGNTGWVQGITATGELEGSLITFADFYGQPLDNLAGVGFFHLARLWAGGLKIYDEDQGGFIVPEGYSDEVVSRLDICIFNLGIYYGNESQGPPPEIVADKGATVTSGNKGLTTLIFTDFPLEISGGQKPATFAEFINDATSDDVRVTVSSVIVDVGAIASLDLDPIGIDDECDGFALSTTITIDQWLRDYQPVYNYLIVEPTEAGDPIKLIRRDTGAGLTVDFEIDADEVVGATAEDAGIELIPANEVDLPSQVDVHYQDPSIDFTVGLQFARFPLYPPRPNVHQGSVSVMTDFVISATEARQLAYDILYRTLGQSTTVRFALSNTYADYLAIEPADIVRISGAEQGTLTILITNSVITHDDINELTGALLLADGTCNVLGDAGEGGGALVAQDGDVSSPAGPHRHWGLMVESVSSLVVSLSEIEMRATISGADQLGAGTPSATSTAGGSSPADAIDNNAATQWISFPFGASICERWMYDEGAGPALTVVEVALSTGETSDRAPKDAWLVYSDDGSTWYADYGITDQTGWVPPETRTFSDPGLDPAAAHRYWVLLVHGGTSTVGIAELQMRATHGGADQCFGGTALSCNSLSGTVTNAFDNDVSTFASSGSPLAWIGYAFDSDKIVVQISLTRPSASPSSGPIRGSMMCSDDGIHYSKAWDADFSYTGDVCVSSRP